jgi:hypothetical protein
MPYYKDTKNNNIYFTDNADCVHLPSNSYIPITDAQAKDIYDIQNAKQTQLQLDIKNREYLLNTDWYVIRFIEKGINIPADIGIARQLARDAIKG